MKIKTKRMLLAISRRGENKEFENPNKTEIFPKRFRIFQSAARKLTKSLKLDNALTLLYKLGYREVEVKYTELGSVEGHIVYTATPLHGRVQKEVVVFLSNMKPHAIVEQVNRLKGYSWLIHGQAHKNSKNVMIK